MGWAKNCVCVGVGCGALGALSYLGLYIATRMPGREVGRARAAPSADALGVELALRRHVENLSEGIGERNDAHPQELLAARDYMEVELGKAGYKTSLDHFEIGGHQANVIADSYEPRGKRPLILVSAHYDSPRGSVGAQASATSAAALIELARLLRGDGKQRALRFLACAYEEQPREGGGRGRSFSLRHFRSRNEPIELELELGSLGAWSARANSQRHPFPWGSVLPARGDFLLAVGGFDATHFVQRLVGDLRNGGRVPAHGVQGIAFLPGLSWGERVELLDEGPPHVIVSDTGKWRNPDTGTPMDRVDQLDFAGMANAVTALADVLAQWAGIEP